jgi:tetratricopeptide (TPR) repeat protein
MELTDKDIEQLTALWEGSLSDNDRQDLENRLQSDANFRKNAQEMHLYTEGLTVIRQRQMRQRLQDLDVTLPPLDPPSSTNWLKIILVALVFALAAFGVWRYMAKEDEPVISGPIAAVFEPYPALGITMGDSPDELKKDAMVLYAQKQYTKAIPLLSDSFKGTQDSMLLFYIGVSHLALGQANEAQTVFEKLQNVDSVPQEAAQWYLALSYVASKQYDKAALLLKNNKSEKYKDKVQKLLEEISKKE